MKISATVVGRREVIDRIRAMPARVNDRVQDAVMRGAFKVLRLDKQKLSDDVLHVRTGHLRASQNVRGPVRDGSSVSAYVGFNVWYGKLHELGWTGSVTRTVTTAWGRPMAVPKQVTYTMTIPKRAFLAPSLEELRAEIVEDIKKAVAEGVGG